MKKKAAFSSLLVLVFAAIMFFPGNLLSAAEQSQNGNELQPSDLLNYSYSDYLKEFKDTELADESIVLDAENIASYKSENVKILSDFQDKGSVIQIEGENGEIQWDFDVENDGFYNILLEYYPLESKYSKIDIAVNIDGKIPFDEAAKIVLSRSWKNEREISSDSRGNNICPKQVLTPTWLKTFLYDAEGLISENLRFHFSKGRHTIKIITSRSDMILHSLNLLSPKELPTYKVVSGKYGKMPEQNIPNIIIEGENADLTSDSILHPIYDRSDPATSPADPVKLLLNTIGGNDWNQIGQWIAWKVKVPEDGYYKISMRARQNLLNGRNSYRRVYVDGEVGFSELNAVKFHFENGWYMKTLGDQEPYLFFLKQGTHEIKLEIVPGELCDVHNILEACVYKMNETYRKIIMITGTEADPYRDYMIQKDIPDLLDTFKNIRDELTEQKQSMEMISGKMGGSEGLLESLIVQLDSFISKPDTIPLRLDKYKANISSLMSWLLSIEEQPLEIDYLEVSPYNNKLAEGRSNIFDKFLFGLRSIIGSFNTNYNIVGDFDNEEDAITVWVGMGRDQVQIVKDLVDNDFVPNTGIKVNVNLVKQGLIEATLAGKGPDISLFVASSQPVDLAARGAVVNLKQFEDYDAVSSRFMKEALVPFSFEGGSYALPATQSFPMLFYRKDIFSELGIEPPETWDDFYHIAPVIQRNNLELGIGSDIGTFATLLFQKGGKFYNEKRSSTLFESKEAINAFTQWTDFFTKYSLPLTYDFLNRFRTGEMPIGIAQYTQYNVLQVSAPEIKNLWEMISVPASVRDDGTLDNSVCGGSVIDGCIMFKKVKNKRAAWEFLKWITSADVQAELGIALESQMGPAGRYATANVEALKYLPWNQKEISLLYKQWNDVKEIPEIPASYFITRNITNAFRKVVYDYENPRHTLNQYNYEMNKEVKRKRIEFGLDAGQ